MCNGCTKSYTNSCLPSLDNKCSAYNSCHCSPTWLPQSHSYSSLSLCNSCEVHPNHHQNFHCLCSMHWSEVVTTYSQTNPHWGPPLCSPNSKSKKCKQFEREAPISYLNKRGSLPLRALSLFAYSSSTNLVINKCKWTNNEISPWHIPSIAST